MPREQAFFDRQPQHVQDMVLRMSGEHTASDVIDHLNRLGIYPTIDQLGHFRRKHSTSVGRHTVTSPTDTFAERILQYISAIPLHNGETWSNKNLEFSGQIWTRCATKLCDENMIEMIARRPARYRRLVPHDKIKAWYDKEVSRQ